MYLVIRGMCLLSVAFTITMVGVMLACMVDGDAQGAANALWLSVAAGFLTAYFRSLAQEAKARRELSRPMLSISGTKHWTYR